LPHFNELNQINFSFCHIESFSIKADKDIHLLNNNDLRKKNFILKENLKFLLNEMKKYRKNEQNNITVKEYESHIEYYINEIEKYQKEIIILKEKYSSVIKENEELKKYINSELTKLKNFPSFNSVCKTETNKSTLLKPNKMVNLKSFKYLNLNIKNYIDKSIKIKRNRCPFVHKSSRNIIKTEMSYNNNLLIDDKNFGNNYNKNSFRNVNKNNYTNNNSENFRIKVIKKINNNFSYNTNKNKAQKLNEDYKNNNINQNNFKMIENGIKFHNSNNKTLSKKRINKNTLINNSFEINGSNIFSQSFRNYKDAHFKEFKRKKFK
jgi:hypothetical protein